jgi:alcohol dehydrogenase (cytochrome c)
MSMVHGRWSMVDSQNARHERRAVFALLLMLLATASLGAQVSFDRLLQADREPQNWLTYSGTYLGQRYSQLTQITPDNVKTLELQWVFQAKSIEKFEATALVVDGIMYTVQPPNDIVALDAATGRTFWQYSYRPSPASRPCCGRVNRGLAILGETLFMGTIDGHLVAVDAKTGSLIWDTAVARPEAGYSLTHAPLVVKDKVIVGTAGGEYGIRGFLAAYDARTGKEAWRFYTIPGPGEPGHDTWAGDSWKRGGGPIWVTGSYDRDLNLTYWGVGNPGPDFNGDVRMGDNLYTDSVIALDADTGQLKWHYQFSPHDEFDYDATQVPVLTDLAWNGRPRKVLMFGNRNGIFYVLDRATGEFLLGKPFVKVTWMDGFDAKGRPKRVPGMTSSFEGVTVFPGNQGGTNWYNPAFSPRTGLFYIPSWVNYSTTWVKTKVDYVEGRVYTSGIPRFTVPRDLQSWQRQPVNQRKEDEGYGAVRAIDPHSGDLKWEYKMSDFTDGGILATASDLVFTGGREGYVVALNARTGEPLWKFSVGGVVASGPMTYSVSGRQYVAVAAGSSLFAFALHQ